MSVRQTGQLKRYTTDKEANQRRELRKYEPAELSKIND